MTSTHLCEVTAEKVSETLKSDMRAELHRIGRSEEELIEALEVNYRRHMFVSGSFRIDTPFSGMLTLSFEGRVCDERRTITVYK